MLACLRSSASQLGVDGQAAFFCPRSSPGPACRQLVGTLLAYNLRFCLDASADEIEAEAVQQQQQAEGGAGGFDQQQQQRQ